MSSSQVTETQLRPGFNHFEFDTEIRDPSTGLVTNFRMEIDTGNPFAIALPTYCEAFFTKFEGRIDVGGAGSGLSPMYSAELLRVGDINLDFSTYAVMTLDSDDQDYGLLGINFLKHLNARIFDDPSQKKLRLRDVYL